MENQKKKEREEQKRRKEEEKRREREEKEEKRRKEEEKKKRDRDDKELRKKHKVSEIKFRISSLSGFQLSVVEPKPNQFLTNHTTWPVSNCSCIMYHISHSLMAVYNSRFYCVRLNIRLTTDIRCQ